MTLPVVKNSELTPNGRHWPEDWTSLLGDMQACPQMPGLSVFDHGVAVRDRFNELCGVLRGRAIIETGQWRLPAWIYDYSEEMLSHVAGSEDLIGQYLLFHDCGKPYCREVDREGRSHFPDHAAVSEQVWLRLEGDSRVARLIRDDMIIHERSAEFIADCLVSRWTAQESVILVLAALAEVHANAGMFGGLETTSFKSKWKTIDRRGKQILKYQFPDGGTHRAVH